jgi:nitrile hydratase subunit beta
MTELFTSGARVQTSRTDPPHHTRLPRYARGAVGIVIECEGAYPRPDDRARGLDAEPEPVYAVRFAARDLFGEGDHTVTIALWRSYLRLDNEEAG